jgi:hypothetical protein
LQGGAAEHGDLGCIWSLAAEGRESSIVVLGEKGKAQLQRDQRSHIRTTITELGKFKMTFAQVRFGYD